MDRNIVTQAEIAELKFQLAEIADNLSVHINQSLSKAHGINLVTGYVDSNGNDLTTYQDSNGDIVGRYFIVFFVNNTLYYAPGQATSLAGQPETTGQIDTTGTEELIQGTGGSAWITDYTSVDVLAAQNVRDDVLLPHTLLGHWETHGSLTVLPEVTVDDAGHTVGRYVIKMNVNNVTYKIPCDVRFGGPPQPPRILSDAIFPQYGATAVHITSPKGTSFSSQVPGGVLQASATFGGTKPVTQAWQVFDVTDFIDLPASTYTQPGTGWNITYTGQTTGTLLISDGNPGGNNITRSGFLRLRANNGTGDVFSRQLTLTLTDETGCWICSEVWRARRAAGLPARNTDDKYNEHFRDLVKHFLRYNREMARFYLHDCEPLVQKMKLAGVNFVEMTGFNDSIIRLMRAGEKQAATILYMQTIMDCIATYWPDCPHPVWLKYRHLRSQP
jgi:hypothetical protein